MRRSFARARTGMTSDSRCAPFTIEVVCATGRPAMVGAMATFAPPAGCRSERVTRKETVKRLPATGGPLVVGGPMIGLLCGSGDGAGGAGVVAVTSAVLLVGFESGIS